jgi:uncharacterized protein YceK
MIKGKTITAIAILLITALVLTGCGTGVANATPVQAAQTTVQAMINGNEQALKQIDMSNTLDFPPQWMLEIATQQHFDTANFNDFTFTPVGDHKVRVADPKINYNTVWSFVHQNGGWYFFTMTNGF